MSKAKSKGLMARIGKATKKTAKEGEPDASCTAADLEKIIQFYDPQMTLSTEGYDEVYPNIYIGDG